MSVPGVGGVPAFPDLPRESSSNIGGEVDQGISQKISAIDEAIRFSKQVREQKIDQLLKDQIAKLGKDLSDLNEYSLIYSKWIDEQKEISEEEELGARADQIEQEIKELDIKMKEKIEMLVKAYPHLGVNKGMFSDWWSLHRLSKDIRRVGIGFIQEQISNRCANKILFLQEVESNLIKHKEIIVRNFVSEKQLDLEQVYFKMDLQGSETHNKGKAPVKVTVLIKGRPECHIFYKPRDAGVDSAVLDLFLQINKLSRPLKSQNIDLPFYRIVNVKEGEFSLWECVEGEQGKAELHRSVSQMIAEKPAPQQGVLYKHASRLEQVCKYLNISDLHPDNVILKNPETMNPEIVPIDLESFQEGNETGLFDRNPPSVPLTQEEKDILDKFKDTIDSYSVRLVPLATSTFLGGMTKCDSFVDIDELIRGVLKRLKYDVIQPDEVIQKWILNDFINNDVPYLTQHNKGLYYGMPSGGKIMADRST